MILNEWGFEQKIRYYEWGFARKWCLHERGFALYYIKRGDNTMGKPVFKRKIYEEILEWKEKRSNKYALLIKGAYVKIGLNQEKPYKTRV